MKHFTVSVSRMARGKSGYQGNKYKFGNSFYPETHTIASLISLAAIEGYTFLAGEFARELPTAYGRTDVSTMRITENFRQTCIIPLDDDGKSSDAVQFWENDELFQQYGGGYYHSDSSTPATPRIRPIFELDQAITDHELYQTARRALAWYYNRTGPRVDPIPQIPQPFYGCSLPAKYEIIGAVLPLIVLRDNILLPYQVQQKRQATRRGEKQSYTGGANHIGLVKWLAAKPVGRHNALVAIALTLKDEGFSWSEVGGDVIAATKTNGYYQDYAKTDAEIERVFKSARKATK